MNLTYPIHSDGEDEYLISIESFDKKVISDECLESINGIEIYNITLERVSGNNATGNKILSSICNTLAGFLNDNDNVLLYFYCDDVHDVKRRNSLISPQEYRSRLFSKMFERYQSLHCVNDIINLPLIIRTQEKDIFIHIICKKNNKKYAESILTLINRK